MVLMDNQETFSLLKSRSKLRQRKERDGLAFHQLCPRYSGTLTPTAPTAIRLWDTFTFTFYTSLKSIKSDRLISFA